MPRSDNVMEEFAGDPEMNAIREQLMGAQPATGAPTNILPEDMQRVARAHAMSRNANARPGDVNTIMQQLQQSPDMLARVIQQVMPQLADTAPESYQRLTQDRQNGVTNTIQPSSVERDTSGASPEDASTYESFVSPVQDEANASEETAGAANAQQAAGEGASGGQDVLTAILSAVVGALTGGTFVAMGGKKKPPAQNARQAIEGDINSQQPEAKPRKPAPTGKPAAADGGDTSVKPNRYTQDFEFSQREGGGSSFKPKPNAFAPKGKHMGQTPGPAKVEPAKPKPGAPRPAADLRAGDARTKLLQELARRMGKRL